MKLLALLLTCLPCFAQFPYSGVTWSTKSSGFAPVAGYFMWYSVFNNVTNSSGVSPPANGDGIKAWGDLSTNLFHLQKLGGSLPTYRLTTGDGGHSFPPNGSPYISFGLLNGNQALTNKFTTTFAQPNTFFIVLNDSSRNGGCLLNGASDQNQQIILGAPPGGLQLYAGSSMNANQPAGDIWVVWTIQFNQASTLLRSNSVPVSLSGTTVGTGGLTGITLGNFFNLSMGGNPAVTEFMGYNSALISADMLKNEEYLANKYGITGVP